MITSHIDLPTPISPFPNAPAIAKGNAYFTKNPTTHNFCLVLLTLLYFFRLMHQSKNVPPKPYAMKMRAITQAFRAASNDFQPECATNQIFAARKYTPTPSPSGFEFEDILPVVLKSNT